MKVFKNKQNWMKLHLYLSLFFLPAALLYALTGALYLLHIREDYGATIHEISLPIIQKGQEKDIILQTLQEHNIPLPKNTDLRNMRGNLTMGTITHNVSLIKNKDGGYTLRSFQPSLYGILLLMHKGKGKFYFDIIAIGFALSLIIFYISGLIMTSFCKKKRKFALITFLCGFALTTLMIFLSI